MALQSRSLPRDSKHLSPLKDELFPRLPRASSSIHCVNRCSVQGNHALGAVPSSKAPSELNSTHRSSPLARPNSAPMEADYRPYKRSHPNTTLHTPASAEFNCPRACLSAPDAPLTFPSHHMHTTQCFTLQECRYGATVAVAVLLTHNLVSLVSQTRKAAVVVWLFDPHTLTPSHVPCQPVVLCRCSQNARTCETDHNRHRLDMRFATG